MILIRKYILTFTSVTLLVSLPVSQQSLAGTPDELIQQANEAYTKKTYAQSIDLYEQVLRSGFESSQLYYNLGNACFKQNQYPQAILNYERAIRLNPGNENIQFNLKLVNSKIVDKIESVPRFFLITWWEQINSLTSVNGWAWTGVILFFISLVLFALFFFAKSSGIRKSAFWLGFSFLIFFFFSIHFAFRSYKNLMSHDEAIVFTPSVTVKSSPDSNSVDLFVVHEGTKVAVVDRIGDWMEIRLANGSVGWLQNSSVELI